MNKFSVIGTKEVIKKQPGYGDVGEFSRYFNLDAWWESRIKQLPESVQKTFHFMIVPKASKSEKNKGLDKLPKKKSSSMPCLLYTSPSPRDRG